MNWQITISEAMDATGLRLLTPVGTVSYEPALWQNPAALAAAVHAADALIIRNQTRVTRELLAMAPRLRVIGRLGAGLDNIDLKAARNAGVAVVYAPGGNAQAVAEYVLAACLMVHRPLAAAAAAVAEGRWERAEHTGRELCGKTLGLVGYGHIGRCVARLAAALGMTVLAYDPYTAHAGPCAEIVELPMLLAESDVVSLHVPLTPETTGLVEERFLALMKPGALLINTARGSIVDEEAVAAALRSGRLGGAVLDVRAQEPPGPEDPLLGLPTVWTTPHIAGLTHEAQGTIACQVARDVLRVLEGAAPLHPAPLLHRSWAS